MSDFTFAYIIAAIIFLHFLAGFGWVFWKMRKKK